MVPREGMDRPSVERYLMPFERLTRLWERVQTYPWWQVAIEIGVIWLVAYVIIRFVQGTRAAGALKGMLLILLVATLLIRIVGSQEFQRLKFLYDNFLTLVAVTLIVVFQPELRRGLIRLGETSILRRSQLGSGGVIDSVVDASKYLSRARFGGIIVIQRDTSLKGLIEGGTAIDAKVSARLLQTIFFPGSALHDLAVIVHQDRVVAAGVQLPLAEPEEMPDPSLGSRHRAAVGLSKECDALVVVVSEETGAISLAERGRLDFNLGVDRLREELATRLAGRRGSGGANGHIASSASEDSHAGTALEIGDPRD